MQPDNTTDTPTIDITSPKVIAEAFNILVTASTQYRGTKAEHEAIEKATQVIKAALERDIGSRQEPAKPEQEAPKS